MKTDQPIKISEENLGPIQICGSSDSFAEMIAANPTLITYLGASVATSPAATTARSCAQQSTPSVLSRGDDRVPFAVGRIARRDRRARRRQRALDLEANRLQTELATASMNVAYLIARREMARRYGSFSGGPRVAFYGLGRLGSGGVDYGRISTFSSPTTRSPSPIKSLTQDETYSRLVELMIAALSSITRGLSLSRRHAFATRKEWTTRHQLGRFS